MMKNTMAFYIDIRDCLLIMSYYRKDRSYREVFVNVRTPKQNTSVPICVKSSFPLFVKMALREARTGALSTMNCDQSHLQTVLSSI